MNVAKIDTCSNGIVFDGYFNKITEHRALDVFKRK